MQSTTFDTAFASLAVDGNDKTFACTDRDSTEPWWSVDLGWKVSVDRVVIHNPHYCELSAVTSDNASGYPANG